MKLVDIYIVTNAKQILYNLLNERDATVNISHKHMPSWEDHCQFVDSRPYSEWMLIISDDDLAVGAVYLSRFNEIGVQVFKNAQRRGYARFAVNSMIIRHPDKRLLANINPDNKPSIKLFSSFGFKFIQVTFERVPCTSTEGK